MTVTPTAAPPVPRGDIARVALSLARWFDAGATLWCASPAWPHHARHVAVEFVHPVMVGKPALPAVALPSEDLVTTVRASAAPGDVVVAIAPAADVAVSEVVRRAPAWGVHTIWIGNGPRPVADQADHVLWVDDDRAEVDGRFILLYHLLWELTHVCFEHAQGRLAETQGSDADVCVTCADDGRVAEVQATDGAEAIVRLDGEVVRVDASLVAPVAEHDLLLVHAGTAISRLDGVAGQRP